MEAPCKAFFFTWRPLVRLFFYLEVPCKAFFLLGDNDDGDHVGVGAVVHTLLFTWRPLVRPLFLFGGPL